MIVFATLISACAAISLFFFRKGGIYNPLETATEPLLVDVKQPQATSTPATPPIPSTVEPSPAKAAVAPLDFSTQKAAWHSVRVLCDELDLLFWEKNLICSCIFQESRFKNGAVGRNATSTDWGIVQVNDRWNIGAGKPFPSVEYVLANPERCVRWMIACYKQGHLNLWASYSTGAYQQWLPKSSAMWALAVDNAKLPA